MNQEFNQNRHNFFLETENKTEKVNRKVQEKSDREINEYDELVSEDEIGNFKNAVEQNIELKASELGISKDKLIELAELDLESLEPQKLKSLNLNRGNLEFIRDSIYNSLNEFLKSGEPNILLKESTSQFLEFIKKHKGKISIAQLGLYLTAFGSPALKELTGANAKVEIYGKEISLKDLADNPELIKEIGEFHNGNTPVDVLKSWQNKEFEYNNTAFNFNTKINIGLENTVKKSIYFGDMAGKIEELDKLNNDLNDSGLSFNYLDGGVPLEKFIENKDKISEFISKDLNIPKELVGKYIEEFLMPDTSKISVVRLNEFKINKDFNLSDGLELRSKKNELFEKYDVYSPGEFNATNWLKAINEFEKWTKEKGINDPNKALAKEMKDYKDSPVAKFKELKNYNENFNKGKNFDKFEELFLETLENENESIDHLKEVATENPEEVIKMISKILGNNIEYDWDEIKSIDRKEFKDLEKKHAEGIPYITLKNKLGVCHDYAATFTAAKYVLEEKGVPNLDKFIVLYTGSDKMNHAWNNLLTVDKEGNLKVTSIDLTWADDKNISKIPEKLNAVDEKHYYTAKIEESHKKAIEKILNFNRVIEQEKLREILMTYEP